MVSGYQQKLESLYERLQQLEQMGITKMIIFCGTKKSTEELCQQLYQNRYRAFAIHGDKEQPARERCLGELKRQHKCLLVATDVAQRGLDIPNLPAVINFDMPEQLEDYVHRIGRTGRAGRAGKAVTFFTEADAEQLRAIANVMKASGCDVPDWMLRMKKLTKEDRRRRAVKPLSRKGIAKRPRSAGAAGGDGEAGESEGGGSNALLLNSQVLPQLPSSDLQSPFYSPYRLSVPRALASRSTTDPSATP